MATFAAHVFVHGESGPVHFAPGDELPEWADGVVGKHCLVEVETDAPDLTAGGAEGGEGNSEGADGDPDADDADKNDDDGEDKGDDDADGGDDVDPTAKTDAPDFTAPAPRRGRPRKA